MVRMHRTWAGVAGALALTACADGTLVAPDAPGAPRALVLTGGDLTTFAPQTSYPLYAGGGGDGTGTQVGVVKVSHTQVGPNTFAFTVTYDLAAGYCATETHLQIAASPGDVPQRNGNPTPGQMARKGTHSCVSGADITYTGYQVTIPATHNGVVIAAHAVVQGQGGAPVVVQPAADFVSGGAGFPIAVTQRRNGDVGVLSAITNGSASPVDKNAINPALQQNITQFWNSEITKTSGFGRSQQTADDANHLLGKGAEWVWEAPFSDQSLNGSGQIVANGQAAVQGSVIQMNASVTIAAPTTGTFRITCDNGYRVLLNGQLITTDDGAVAGLGNQLASGFNLASSVNGAFGSAAAPFTTGLRQGNVNYDGWQSVQRFNVNLKQGPNDLTVWAVNEYMNTDDPQPSGSPFNPLGDRNQNPAGCIFGLQVNEVSEPGGPSIGEETAWGAPTRGQGFTGKENEVGNFTGNNWATYIIYRVRELTQ